MIEWIFKTGEQIATWCKDKTERLNAWGEEMQEKYPKSSGPILACAVIAAFILVIIGVIGIIVWLTYVLLM